MKRTLVAVAAAAILSGCSGEPPATPNAVATTATTASAVIADDVIVCRHVAQAGKQLIAITLGDNATASDSALDIAVTDLVVNLDPDIIAKASAELRGLAGRLFRAAAEYATAADKALPLDDTLTGELATALVEINEACDSAGYSLRLS